MRPALHRATEGHVQKIRLCAGLRPYFLAGISILLIGTAIMPQSVRSDGLRINSVELTAGPMVSVSTLQWSIAGATDIPNILSELTWWNLRAEGGFLSVRIRHNSLLFSADADFGIITSGSNTDYDYNGSNRSNVNMYSVNESNAGLIANASFGGGYSIRSLTSGTGIRLDLTGGWYLSAQNLVIGDGVQYYVSPSSPTTVHTGLSATYDTSWTGPFFGIAAENTFPGGVSLSGSLRLHYAFYNSVADWIGRSAFAHPASFRQWSQGAGVTGALGFSIPVAAGLGLSIGAHALIFTTFEGTDRLYDSNSGWIDSLFNGVTWKSFGVWIGIHSIAQIPHQDGDG